MTPQEYKVLKYLEGYVSENKQQLIAKVLSQRTRHFAVVLDDIFQPQNASAAIRTADCFGVQDVYVTENKHKFKINPRVVHGSAKWVDVHQYSENQKSIEHCVGELKDKNYRIIGTVPEPAAKSIYDFDIASKAAFVFGTEQTGISQEMMQYVDEKITIPMYGFTESFNISVSVAIVLSTLVEKLYSSSVDWRLKPEETDLLRLDWYRKIVNRSDLLEKEYLKSL